MNYFLNDIYTCIQGEGCQTGVAMVLIRLHGCEVGCPWCDSKETWRFNKANLVKTIGEALGSNEKYTLASEAEIADYVAKNHPGPKWGLITGGEPADQPLKPLVDALHDRGYKVALETSGTALGLLGAEFDWICVSPKINMPGGKVVFPEVLHMADEIKHVVGRPRDLENLDTLLATAQLKPNAQICLQPVSLNQKATAFCIETVKQRGWRLSLQTHKYINER